MSDYKVVPTAAMAEAERGKWRPIDTVPKDGTNVLLWTPDGIIEAHHRKCLNCGDWWHDWEFSVVEAYSEHVSLESQPTHWMPLCPGPQPAPDVSALVEALERIARHPRTRGDELGYAGCRNIAKEALAAHRKGE